jgi:hypothetical protein
LSRCQRIESFSSCLVFNLFRCSSLWFDHVLSFRPFIEMRSRFADVPAEFDRQRKTSRAIKSSQNATFLRRSPARPPELSPHLKVAQSRDYSAGGSPKRPQKGWILTKSLAKSLIVLDLAFVARGLVFLSPAGCRPFRRAGNCARAKISPPVAPHSLFFEPQFPCRASIVPVSALEVKHICNPDDSYAGNYTNEKTHRRDSI